MLLIGVCDDEDIYCTEIAQLCSKYARKKGLDYELEIFHSGMELLNCERRFDLLFLDIRMEDVNGIEVHDRIWNSGNHQSFVVYITNYEEYMEYSFDLNVLGFLTKPISFEAIERVFKKVEREKRNSKCVYRYKDQKIFLNDILYIEAAGAYTKIYLVNDEVLTERREMKAWEQELKESGFFRVHHSWIVNLVYVEKYSKEKAIVQVKKRSIPISRRRYRAFEEVCQEFRGQRAWGE